MKPHDTDDETLEDLPPSKTKIKKQMHDLRDLGEKLTELNKDKWRELELPESLFDALVEYKRINKFGAQKRQLQYISKLMRDVDTAPILAKLEIWSGNSRQHTAWLHQVEAWRDRMLEEPDTLTEFLTQHPEADVQRLRTLIRNALKEKALNKPPKSYREIFQLLREILPQP